MDSTENKEDKRFEELLMVVPLSFKFRHVYYGFFLSLRPLRRYLDLRPKPLEIVLKVGQDIFNKAKDAYRPVRGMPNAVQCGSLVIIELDETLASNGYKVFARDYLKNGSYTDEQIPDDHPLLDDFIHEHHPATYKPSAIENLRLLYGA